MNYWLLKSEPDVYSINDLAKDGKTLWENIRNYQARNYMMKDMKVGDIALFYHSNAKPAAIVGRVEILDIGIPDPTQFEKKSDYYEPRATQQKPVWYCVEVGFVEKFEHSISLEEIKKHKTLSKMALLNNSRLSVQPVTKSEYNVLVKLSEATSMEHTTTGARDA